MWFHVGAQAFQGPETTAASKSGTAPGHLGTQPIRSITVETPHGTHCDAILRPSGSVGGQEGGQGRITAEWRGQVLPVWLPHPVFLTLAGTAPCLTGAPPALILQRVQAPAVHKTREQGSSGAMVDHRYPSVAKEGRIGVAYARAPVSLVSVSGGVHLC